MLARKMMSLTNQLIGKHLIITRMHSSRMRTARPLTVEGGRCCCPEGGREVLVSRGGRCCDLVPGGGYCCPEGGTCCDLVPGGEGGAVVQKGGGVVTWSRGGEVLWPGPGGRCCCPRGEGDVTWSHSPSLTMWPIPWCIWCNTSPPVGDRMTNTCKNITFARFATRAVIKQPDRFPNLLHPTVQWISLL